MRGKGTRDEARLCSGTAAVGDRGGGRSVDGQRFSEPGDAVRVELIERLTLQ
jgi:riboflavin biosynthesis pyrimidine reductase